MTNILNMKPKKYKFKYIKGNEYIEYIQDAIRKKIVNHVCPIIKVKQLPESIPDGVYLVRDQIEDLSFVKLDGICYRYKVKRTAFYVTNFYMSKDTIYVLYNFLWILKDEIRLYVESQYDYYQEKKLLLYRYKLKKTF